MLALIANIASDGRPIGFIEHVVTAAAFRRSARLRYAIATASITA